MKEERLAILPSRPDFVHTKQAYYANITASLFVVCQRIGSAI